jgi:hypothetical protein
MDTLKFRSAREAIHAWAFLFTLRRMAPREVARAVDRAGHVTVGTAVDQIAIPAFR